MLSRLHAAAIALTAVLMAQSASAEIVFFASGRTMKVRAHREQGSDIALLLPGGGEVVCDRRAVDHIGPDEIPFDDPALAASAIASSFPIPDAIAKLVDEAAARHGVDARLVRAVIQVESAYQASARSRKGAIGLMQLMPDTARRFAVRNPYDPGANIEGGITYLRWLLDHFESSSSLALAAYNAGEAAVERFQGIPPYAETRNYVQAVLKLAGSD